MQPESSMDLSTRLIRKRPPITVDRDGGLFSLSAGHPEAHTLFSGKHRDGSSSGYVAQSSAWSYSSRPLTVRSAVVQILITPRCLA